MQKAITSSLEIVQEAADDNVLEVSMSQDLSVLTLDQLDAVAGGDDVICW